MVILAKYIQVWPREIYASAQNIVFFQRRTPHNITWRFSLAKQYLKYFHIIFLFHFVVQPCHLQPVLKGLPGDANRLERSGVSKFIGRGAADTENGCNVILGVCPAFGHPFSLGVLVLIRLSSICANSILKGHLEALCHKGFC